jgi:hypothetical protein
MQVDDGTELLSTCASFEYVYLLVKLYCMRALPPKSQTVYCRLYSHYKIRVMLGDEAKGCC